MLLPALYSFFIYLSDDWTERKKTKSKHQMCLFLLTLENVNFEK